MLRNKTLDNLSNSNCVLKSMCILQSIEQIDLHRVSFPHHEMPKEHRQDNKQKPLCYGGSGLSDLHYSTVRKRSLKALWKCVNR